MNAGFAVVLGAGMMAAFNPCGVAMLPSYIVHLIAGRERRAWDGLWAGILMTAGFLLVFMVAGVIAATFAAVLGKAVAWIAEVIGVAFILLGIIVVITPVSSASSPRFLGWRDGNIPVVLLTPTRTLHLAL